MSKKNNDNSSNKMVLTISPPALHLRKTVYFKWREKKEEEITFMKIKKAKVN